MPFPESVKLEAKKRAHYVCVICKEPFLEVHHIIPESEEGPNTIDNAAPLCASCHDRFGGNPDKQKTIREMRDFWWEMCAKRESNPDYIKLNEKLDTIQTSLHKSQTSQQNVFEEIKEAFVTFHHSSGDSVVTSKNTLELSQRVGFQFPTGFSNCPNCGTPGSESPKIIPSNPGIWPHRPWRKCSKCSVEFPE